MTLGGRGEGPVLGKRTESTCYLCGNSADGADEHVPPEVFFRGKEATYKSPEIRTVPSCAEHNEGTSHNDEACAWIVTSAAALRSQVAFDVHQQLHVPVFQRARSDTAFVDERLALIGTRILRSAEDYDASGNPKFPTYDAQYMGFVEERLKAHWKILKSTFQKIAAGVFYLAQGRPLGSEHVRRLKVLVPGFKQVEPVLLLSAPLVSEGDFFGLPSSARWQSIESGNSTVFACEHVTYRASQRLAVRCRFYGTTQVWIRSEE